MTLSAAKFAAFIDVGFLTAGGARALQCPKGFVRPDAEGVVSWLTGTLGPSLSLTFLRAYWYDGAYPPEHQNSASQRRYHHAIDSVPGVQLRLGHIAERNSPLRRPVLRAIERSAARFGVPETELLAEFGNHFTWRPDRTQKGVDTLIVLDLVRLAGRGVFSTAVLIAGDRDLAEAVRTAQDFGIRVVIAVPPGQGLADELRRLADEVVTIEEPALRGMLTLRPDVTDAPDQDADDIAPNA